MLVLTALGEILYQLGKLSDPGIGLSAASDVQSTVEAR
jgi:hypothetical protein